MNGIGAVATTGVLAVILATKFLLGAWVVVVTIPIIVSLFWEHPGFVNISE
jgi:hypothetical protein